LRRWRNSPPGIIAARPGSEKIPWAAAFSTNSSSFGAQNAPPPGVLMRNRYGRILAAGPSYMRAWRKDPDHLAEEAALFASNPGFDATLPHTLHAQPRGLTTLDVPVLLLWGTLDVILLPRQGRRFERLIPGAELRYVRGMGHTPMSDAPEELCEAITEFALERPRARAAQPA